MEIKILYFLILNGLIFSAILIYLGYKKRKGHSKLQLAADFQGESNIVINKDYYKQTKGTNKDYARIQMELDKKEELTDPIRPINVVFTWNGHDWDAYEVLGVPAGSTIDEVKMAYETALSRVDEKSRKIIEKAYTSICQRVG